MDLALRGKVAGAVKLAPSPGAVMVAWGGSSLVYLKAVPWANQRFVELHAEAAQRTGGRINNGKLTVKILGELKRRGGKRGIVTMCIGGGMGFAYLLEMA